MSFLKQLAKNKDFSIYFLSSTNTFSFYAYILVPTDKIMEFENTSISDYLDINKYGNLIDFIIGASEPTEDKRTEVRTFIEAYINN